MRRHIVIGAVLLLCVAAAAGPAAAQDTTTVSGVMAAADLRFETRLRTLTDSLNTAGEQRRAELDRLRSQVALMEQRQMLERERFFNVARLKYSHGYTLIGAMAANTESLRQQLEIVQFFNTIQQLTDPRAYGEFVQTYEAIARSISGRERAEEAGWLEDLMNRSRLPGGMTAAQLVPALNVASIAINTLGSLLPAFAVRNMRGNALRMHYDRASCTLQSIRRLHDDLYALHTSSNALVARYDSLARLIDRERTGYARSLGFARAIPEADFYVAVRDTFNAAVTSADPRFHALYDRVAGNIDNAEAIMVQYHGAVLEYIDHWERMKSVLQARRLDPCVAESGVRTSYERAIAQVDGILGGIRQNYLFTGTEAHQPHHQYYRLVTARFGAARGR